MKILNFEPKPYQERSYNVLGTKITLRAKIVTDYSSFESAFPQPKPPMRTHSSGVKAPNVNDPAYKKAIEKWSSARVVFMIMDSLSPSEGLEWTILDLENPDTLTEVNLIKEFTTVGIPEITAHKMINLATSANGLSEALVEEQRESFLSEASDQPLKDESEE